MDVDARNRSFFPSAESHTISAKSWTVLSLTTRMDGPPEYEVGQHFFFLYSFGLHTDSTSRTQNLSPGLAFTTKRARKLHGYDSSVFSTSLVLKSSYAEILRQGSSSASSYSLSAYWSCRSGKGMVGMKARMSLPRTCWSPNRSIRVQLGTYGFISRRLRTHPGVILGTY